MQHVGRLAIEVTRPLPGFTAAGRSVWQTTAGINARCSSSRRQSSSSRSLEIHRLSRFWIPTGGVKAARESQDDTHALLVRGGYLRQAHSGIFHLLPLGNRVQQKLEKLIDKHMGSLGASKVSLSSVSSEELWEKSGRMTGHGSELFTFTDRKDGKFLLSPTHEEEITALVASSVTSYRDVPLRLYQVSRKYRDEQRPRQGLLRGREFLMKDLYTFDATAEQAKATYEEVRAAYRSFFDELKVPYLVAKADSGAMGGDLSHEYHFVSPKGEDNIISCTSCSHTMNEELAILKYTDSMSFEDDTKVDHATKHFVTKDRLTLVQAVFPKYSLAVSKPAERQRIPSEINIPAIKAALPDIDLDMSIEEPLKFWKRGPISMLINVLDPRIPPGKYSRFHDVVTENRRAKVGNDPILLTRTFPGDLCSACKHGRVQIQAAIEIGHTFYLGTRYSKPLNASVVDKKDKQTFLEMGCHGIGVSRLIAATAAVMSDEKGLNWPASIAPFDVAILPSAANMSDGETIYMSLVSMSPNSEGRASFDPVLDDRDKTLGWRLKDADLIGYPIIVVVGNAWTERKMVDVQCRRLAFREESALQDLPEMCVRLLARL